MTAAFTDAGGIPVNEPAPFAAFGPITLDIPGRPVPLELRVSVPFTGTALPVVLLAHGHGVTNFLSSIHGYGPLTDFLAAHGFIVIQVTHLDFLGYGLRETDTRDAPTFWRDRAVDWHAVLDRLDDVEAAVPGLNGRMDRQRIAAVGHSLGGTTVSLLLGAQVVDPADERIKDLSDTRVKAGVMFGPPGIADEHLSSWAAENYPWMKYPTFDQMTGTALVVAGDEDLNPNFSDRLSYRWDAYTHSPAGNKTLLTVFGSDHFFGGITGYDASENPNENPEMVAAVRALVWAYLRTQLYHGDTAWDNALTALRGSSSPVGKVESK